MILIAGVDTKTVIFIVIVLGVNRALLFQMHATLKDLRETKASSREKLYSLLLKWEIQKCEIYTLFNLTH